MKVKRSSDIDRTAFGGTFGNTILSCYYKRSGRDQTKLGLMIAKTEGYWL